MTSPCPAATLQRDATATGRAVVEAVVVVVIVVVVVVVAAVVVVVVAVAAAEAAAVVAAAAAVAVVMWGRYQADSAHSRPIPIQTLSPTVTPTLSPTLTLCPTQTPTLTPPLTLNRQSLLTTLVDVPGYLIGSLLTLDPSAPSHLPSICPHPTSPPPNSHLGRQE